MKITSLILAVIVLYLVREISLTKHYSCSIDAPKSTQTTNTDRVVSNTSYLRLLQWSANISPDGRYLATSYTGDYKDRFHYYQVFITDLHTDKMHRIFAGDFRTLKAEWTSDNMVKINYDCGTGCLATKIIALNESISMVNSQYDEINEKNGWKFTFFESF